MDDQNNNDLNQEDNLEMQEQSSYQPLQGGDAPSPQPDYQPPTPSNFQDVATETEVNDSPTLEPEPQAPPIGQVFTQQNNVPVIQQVNRGNRKKLGLIIALMAVILILFGGGAAAFVLIQQNNRPEKVLADALVNTANDILEKKPTTAVGRVQFESKSQDNPLKISIDLSGGLTGEDVQAAADVKVEFNGDSYAVKSSTVMFGDSEYYVKLENLKDTAAKIVSNQPDYADFVNMVKPTIEKIDNQWIKITKDDLEEYGSIDREELDKCAEAFDSLRLTKDDQKQLKTLFKENQFIVAGEDFGAETISGENSFHYKLDFNDEVAESFAKSVIELESFAGVKKDCELDEEKISNNFDRSSSSSDNSQDEVKPVIELWVGKKSRKPTKFRVTASDKEMSMEFYTETKFSAENVSIEKPEKSLPVKEVMEELQKNFNQ